MSKVNSAMTGAATGASVGGPWGAAIGGVGGYLMGKDDNSEEIYKKMMEEAKQIPLPVLKELNPELYKEVVRLNPELEQAVTLGPSAMEGIATDPRLKQAQMNALNKLQDISDAGGRDAQFLSDASRVQNDINSNLKGNQDAIIQNMAARGMSGGMTEMVARNQATQSAANRQAQMDLDINAQAQQRALNALMNGGQMGGQMQAQDFNQQAQVAGSKDAISKFNAANTQQVRNNNVNTANNAQQYNATNAQNVADNNVGVRNDASRYNNNLPQQQYENELRKRGLINNAATGMAETSARQAANQDKFIGGVASSAATAYAASKKKQGQ